MNLMMLFQQQLKLLGSFGCRMENMADAMQKMARGIVHPVIDTEVTFDGIDGRWSAWNRARSSARSSSGWTDPLKMSSLRLVLASPAFPAVAGGAGAFGDAQPPEAAAGRWLRSTFRRPGRAWIGPEDGRHRLMLTNLRNAFRKNRMVSCQAIALDELGAIWAVLPPNTSSSTAFSISIPERSAPGRIEVSGIPLFVDLRDNPRPFIVFTAHTGNFELLPVAGNSLWSGCDGALPAAEQSLHRREGVRIPPRPHGPVGAVACRVLLHALARKLEAGGGWACWWTRSLAAA
jgi:hypothetical protein